MIQKTAGFSPQGDRDLQKFRRKLIVERLRDGLISEYKNEFPAPLNAQEEREYKSYLPEIFEEGGYDPKMQEIITRMSPFEIDLFLRHTALLSAESPVMETDREDSQVLGSHFFNSALYATREDIRKIDAALANYGKRQR